MGYNKKEKEKEIFLSNIDKIVSCLVTRLISCLVYFKQKIVINSNL